MSTSSSSEAGGTNIHTKRGNTVRSARLAYSTLASFPPPSTATDTGALGLLGPGLLEVVAAHDVVAGLYGIGSFFRKEPYHDIDFVLVLSCDLSAFPNLAKEIRAKLCAIGDSIGERFDITVFTASEFAAQPLRDMHTLVPLYRRKR